MLFIIADDFGYDEKTTERILNCFSLSRIHATSAMTFMKDSERAAGLSRETKLPVGLHLNLDEEFTADTIPSVLKDRHQEIAHYLNKRKWNQIIYNPFWNC